MSRKSRKGYYVEGTFVAEGSELDRQFRAEFKGTEAQSRTDLKRESEGLQALGEELLTLRTDLLAGLPIAEKLRDAIVEAGRITNFEAQRRHRQFIGKLMRQQEPATMEAIAAALQVQRGQSARENAALHRAETWRDNLIADDARLGEWLSQFPGTDAQQLRALIRQARKDARPDAPGKAVRQGRAYREIFQVVRDHLKRTELAVPEESP